MSEEIPIGPNRCHYCGGEYGEHAEDCRRPKEVDPQEALLEWMDEVTQAVEPMSNWKRAVVALKAYRKAVGK
jgi:hypothetical protein